MRKKLNHGCAVFYVGVFFTMVSLTLFGLFAGSLEAILITMSSETILAHPVSYHDGDKPWLCYSYEVKGKTYENTHSIGHAELAQCLELKAIEVEYSPILPGFSRFEKPSILGLLGILLGNLLLGVAAVIIPLGMVSGESDSAESSSRADS